MVERSRAETDRASAGRVVRMDMHCHSWASDKPVIAALGFLDAPECFSPPEKVYELARARGMDYVTITDHDEIRGAMELVERGFENFVVGEEVSVHFPEDRCMVHVTVWGITPEQHEELGTLGLREDVYAFAQWLKQHNLPHAFAHPLVSQNGRLSVSHLERAALLFKGWEVRNGAHTGTHVAGVEQIISTLTPKRVQELSKRHGVEPVWSRVWQKGRTGGSDDHGLLNVGRTWTQVEPTESEPVEDARDFLRLVMAGRSEAAGATGTTDALTHQIATVGINFYAQRMHDRMSARGQAIGARFCRFAGVEAAKPPKTQLAFEELTRRLLRRKGKRTGLPVIDALREQIGPVLDKYPDLRERLKSGGAADGPAMSQHEAMADFVDDICEALGRAMATGAVHDFRDRNRGSFFDHLMSYAIVQIARAPYIISLFSQNKERRMLERVLHQTATDGSGLSPLNRPMRVSLFTDTLGDVNGVCRFIQNVAEQANRTGRDLQVITSTSFPTPDWDNIFNFEPVFSTRIPRYEQLELALPPLTKILRHLDKHQPDVIHISTPGSVGLIGYIAAKMLRVPVLGVYHTDFPAYVDNLFQDHAFTAMTRWFMQMFYQPFWAVFTRSHDYAESLVELGLHEDRVVPLLPGIDTKAFHVDHADATVWDRVGAKRETVKALYVGRVSVEKNLPMLSRVWARVEARCRAEGLDAELVIVGDGPYRKQMEEEMAGKRVRFLGFRHGDELSSIYASSDFFVFPSTTDTLGQVVMESQASGLPVIVTDKGGPKEVVDPDLTGYVLPSDDAGAWTETILNLIRDDDLRRRLGRSAHTRMQRYRLEASFEHFWKAHEDAWKTHLETLGIRAPEDKDEGASAHDPAPSKA